MKSYRLRQCAAVWLLRVCLRRPVVTLAILAVVWTMLASAAPAQAQTYLVPTLHDFTNSPGDGANPYYGSLIRDSSGNLYGTTYQGGSSGVGTVFELVYSSGTMTYSEKVLHSFTTCCDGFYPRTDLVMDGSGNLYGTTLQGGLLDEGTVFELVYNSGSQTYTEVFLHSFSGTDGAYPDSSLIMDGSGNLYGTTYQGGANFAGAVFELVNSSGSYSETVLHSFTQNGTDGYQPHAALVMDASGNLYGTTLLGGSNNEGTVFELVNSSGSYSETVLHSFAQNGTDGYQPHAALVMDGSGNLYGTTYQGGANGSGAVFELTNSSGTYSEKVLHSFNLGCNGEGADPLAGLIMDGSGNLYGTTYQGGSNGVGTVFELSQFSGTAYATTTTVTASMNPATAGNALTLTASVASASGFVPTGTVAFSIGATVLTTQLGCGKSALDFEDAESAAGIGTYNVAAQYTPDSVVFTASSNSISQTVSERGVVLASGNNTLNGNQTINGRVTTAGGGSGFFGNGSGLTSLNPANLSSGTAGISITGNAATATVANVAATATTATNAVALGNVPAAKYARVDIANSFTGNQAVTGNATISGSLVVGGGSPITEYVSITRAVTLPAIAASACTTIITAAVAGFTPGESDSIALGIPKALAAGLGPGVFLAYQAYETTTTASPTITIRVCNPGGPRYPGGDSGTIRVDIFKH